MKLCQEYWGPLYERGLLFLVLVAVLASVCFCGMTVCAGTSTDALPQPHIHRADPRKPHSQAQAWWPLSYSSVQPCACNNVPTPLICQLTSVGSLVTWRVIATCSATVDKLRLRATRQPLQNQIDYNLYDYSFFHEVWTLTLGRHPLLTLSSFTHSPLALEYSSEYSVYFYSCSLVIASLV